MPLPKSTMTSVMLLLGKLMVMRKKRMICMWVEVVVMLDAPDVNVAGNSAPAGGIGGYAGEAVATQMLQPPSKLLPWPSSKASSTTAASGSS